jgi:hypothetical protein
MNIVLKYGTCEQSTVPWNKIYPSQYDKVKANAEAADNKAWECFAIETELELFSALANGFDVGVAVHANNGFMAVDSDGVAMGGNGSGNHAVGVDGYFLRSNGELVADMYNSWGLNYGRQGRAGVTWARHLASTLRYHQFFAITSTRDSGSGENPPMPIAA